jgi:hypothetical protein
MRFIKLVDSEGYDVYVNMSLVGTLLRDPGKGVTHLYDQDAKWMMWEVAETPEEIMGLIDATT